MSQTAHTELTALMKSPTPRCVLLRRCFDPSCTNPVRSTIAVVQALQELGMRYKDALLMTAILATIDDADDGMAVAALERVRAVITGRDYHELTD